MQQAVTPGEPLAANEDNNIPVRLFAQETTPDRGIDPRKGDDMENEKRIADLEAAELVKDATISELEAGKVDLTAKLEAAEQKLVDIETVKAQADIKAAEKDAEKQIDDMVAKKLPGKREELKADIMAAEGTESRLALMAVLDKNVPDMSAEEQKLNAGESTPEGKDKTDIAIEAAERRSDTEDISYLDALTEELNKGQE